MSTRSAGHEDCVHAPQPVLLPVHLAPDDTEQRLAVDQHLHPVLLHHLVEPAGLVDVFEVVAHARAPLVAHADTDELRCGGLGEGAEALDGGGGLEGMVLVRLRW